MLVDYFQSVLEMSLETALHCGRPLYHTQPVLVEYILYNSMTY